MFTFLFCHLLYAQVEKEQQLLFDILQEFEQQFDCHFSYADKTIAKIHLDKPKNITSLKNAIVFLRKQTDLKYTVLKDNNISISIKDSSNSFCGFLMDIDTYKPIVHATVSINNKVVVSDESGYFEMYNIPVGATLVVSHLSYKTIHYLVSLKNNVRCEPLYLTPRVEQINEIVIRDYLTKGIRKTVSGAFDIDYKRFDMLPGLIEPDVLQTLQALPGVQSVNESVSNINIRGGAHHENLLLWDEMKMYQSGHFFGLISAFNSHLTKNATLIKNGTEANYSEGVSGTILMQTDTNINQELKVEFGLNLINADAFLDMPIGNKSSIQLSARKSINNLVKTPTYKQYFNKVFQNTEVVDGSENVINSNDEFSFYDVNVRWLYEISPNDKIRVNFLAFNNDLIFSENAIINGVEESKESSAFQKNLATGIFYNKVWNPKFSTDIQFYVTQYNLESTNFDILNNQRLIQENIVEEESIKLNTEFKISDNISLFNGYQYQETGVTNIQDVDNPLFYSKIKQVIRSHGYSSQIGYQSVNQLTTARVGVRLNYIEKFGSFLLEPRLSFSQRISDNFTVQILGELKHQTATQIIDFQDDFLGVENRRWILANEDKFPIVESIQGSVGVFYTKFGWLISIEGYYKKVDGITTKSQGFQNQYQFVNSIGSYHVFGADFLIRKKFKSMNTWLSYSYADNQYNFTDLADTEFPNNFDITHSVSLAATYSLNNLDVSAGLNWHSGKPTTKPVDGNEIIIGNINYEAANSSRLNDYMRVDISAQYRFKLSKSVNATTGISIWNLLNKENITNSYYRVNDGSVDEIQQVSLGFTPNASFRVSF